MWIKSGNGVEPPKNRILLIYCPDWSKSGYQVAEWNGKEFVYDEQPNDMFNHYAIKWSLIFEAD